MKSSSLHIILTTCFLFAVSVASAHDYGYIIGDIWTQDAAGELHPTDLSGVVAEACTLRDTLYAASLNGHFLFDRAPVGPVTLHITHISFAPQTVICEVKKNAECRVRIIMQEASTQIKEITVNGEIPVMTQHGDTLVYNAAAIRTLEGDAAIRIVEQLPGAEVGENKVTILGEQIARTYVDGKLVFGSDPMAALQNMLAKEVLKIRAYDEYADRSNKRKNRQGDKKERVFNIETKSGLLSQLSGEVIGSYGADFGQTGRERRSRYGIGLNIGSFTEKWQLRADGLFNNTGSNATSISQLVNADSPKSAYTRATNAHLNVGRAWQTKTEEQATASVNYVFERRYSREQSVLQQLYFPTAEYTAREYADTSRSSSTARTHRVDAMLLHPNVLSGDFILTHGMAFNDDKDDLYQSTVSTLDGSQSVGSRQRNDKRYNGYNLNEDISWRYKTNRRFSFGFGLSATIKDGDGSGYRVDTLTSTATRKVLQSSGDGRSEHYGGGVDFAVKLSKERQNDLTWSYGYSSGYDRTRQLAIDLADLLAVQTDTINTFNYTNRQKRHRAELGWVFYIPKIKATIRAKAEYWNTLIDRDERFPEGDNYRKRFHSFLPALIFNTSNIKNKWQASYTVTPQLPSVEQLRPRLDDQNPYMLVAGNSALGQSLRHRWIVSNTRIFGKANNTLTAEASCNYTANPIVWRTVFFTEATRLPGWDYTAPAQSTLTTYENAGGMVTADGRIQFKRMIKAIRCNLDASIRYAYENAPSYIGERANRTRSHIPGADLGLKSNFSDKVRFTLGAAATYVHSENTASETDKYCRTSLAAGLELPAILKHLHFNARYNAAFYNRFGGRAYNTADHILNLALGCKFLKRRADLSVVVYDVLNRNTGFQTAMYSDYVQNRWSYSFGRYFTVNLGYKFNSVRTGK